MNNEIVEDENFKVEWIKEGDPTPPNVKEWDYPSLLQIFKGFGAYQEGHFVLSSGLHSDVYIQSAQILKYPFAANMFGHKLAEYMMDTQPEMVLTAALGGVIIGHEVAKWMRIPHIFAERVKFQETYSDADSMYYQYPKQELRLRRGFEIKQGQRILIIEDVLTTGLTSNELMQLIEENGGNVVGVGALVVRDDIENIRMKWDWPFKLQVRALEQVKASIWKERECPQCKSGIEFSKPGSR